MKDVIKKIPNILVILSWLISTVGGPTTVFAHETTTNISTIPIIEDPSPSLDGTPVPDSDYDGIPTAVEQAGWHNEKGGPYVTDPNKPDTDGDGLTDGLEQLYDTNPVDDTSPGIYVEYRDELQTKKFYPWRQHGSRYIVHGEISPSHQRDVIVRRGTLFYVGGPPGATLEIIPSKESLDPLEIVTNSCTTGWALRPKSNGTVGTYELKVSRGGWSKSLTLHVILELDGPSQAYVDQQNAHYNDGDPSTAKDYMDVILYNDDRNNLKDTITFYFDTSYEYLGPKEQGGAVWDDYKKNHAIYGWGIGWETDYNQQYVFEDIVMPTINGLSSRSGIAVTLRDKVNTDGDTANENDLLNFNAFVFPNSTKNAIKNFDEGDCNSHAGLYTTFLKAAGIMARPLGIDWKDSHYDFSAEAWLNDQWLVTRAYTHNDLTPRSNWANKVSYKAPRDDMLLTFGPSWKWDQININYSTQPPSQSDIKRDYITGRYESQNPQIFPHGNGSTIRRWNWVKTPTQDFWNSKPPVVIGDCSDCGTAPIGFSTTGQSLTGAGIQALPQTSSPQRVVTDYGVDLDNDGRYDQLVVEVEVQIDEAGHYLLDGYLNDTDPNTRLGVQIDGITGDQVQATLQPGLHILKLTFDGKQISQKNAPGPYVIGELNLVKLEAPFEGDYVPKDVVLNNLIDSQSPHNYLMDYAPTDFEDWGATLSGNYTHQAQDTNGDGFIDKLIVNTTLNITENGIYNLNAELANSSNEMIATATWSGSGPNASLVFEGFFSDPTTYHFQNIYLSNADGKTFDSDLENGTIAPAGGYVIPPLYKTGISGSVNGNTLAVTKATQVDTNSNGKFDRLDFTVNAIIPVAGTYRVEGWLESASGSMIAWQASTPVSVGTGNQVLTLSFDGKAINAFRTNGPYKLTALKLSWVLNNTYTTIDELPQAYTTSAYTFASFDGSFDNSNVMFDNLENGGGTMWNLAQTTWGLTNEAAASPTHSWTDSPYNKYSPGVTTLTTKNFVVSHGDVALISFQSCYDISTDGDKGEIQVSVEGGPWTPAIAATSRTGSSNGWITENIVASEPAFGADKNVAIRFVMNANSSNHANGWYVDDVSVTFDSDADDDGIPNAVELGNNPNKPADTDNDGIPDYADTDSDNNGIPDQIEGTKDTDKDNVPDYKDPDNDGDGILDVEEGTDDTDNDGIPDYNDTDSDGDGIPDQIEGNIDSDDDGIPDYKDTDSDNDGIPDKEEGNADTDKDGIPDFRDDDVDGNGFLDEEEGTDDLDGDGIPNFRDFDNDGNGIPDQIEGDADTDNDGIPNYMDFDDDGDGIKDIIEIGDDPNNPANTDGDSQPDYLDEDSDGDTILDKNEWSNSGNHPFCTNNGGLDTDSDYIANCQDNDIDGDSLYNYMDDDSDGDGKKDVTEVGNPNNPNDSDDDGIPDYYDSEDNKVNEGPILAPIFLPLILR